MPQADDTETLLLGAADNLAVFRIAHVDPCRPHERYERQAAEINEEIVALHRLAARMPMLEAALDLVQATDALARPAGCVEGIRNKIAARKVARANYNAAVKAAREGEHEHGG